MVFYEIIVLIGVLSFFSFLFESPGALAGIKLQQFN